MHAKDSKKAKSLIDRILARDFHGLKREKLKGFRAMYRIRTGDFRIFFFDDGDSINIKDVRRRNERTYKDIPE